MENIEQKAAFLKSGFTNALQQLDIDAPHKWGKMNVMQMTEHMTDAFRVANGRELVQILTPEDVLPKMQAFLATEKPFRENTPNALLPDEPPIPRHTSKQDAINELQQEIDYFFEIYAADKDKTLDNPFFGNLNHEQQVQLLYKHSTHHLRQFGVDNH
jgi:hypothetical protein